MADGRKRRKRRTTSDIVLDLAKRWERKGLALLKIGQPGTIGAGEMARGCARELSALITRRRKLH